jgi:hypothetical protein
MDPELIFSVNVPSIEKQYDAYHISVYCASIFRLITLEEALHPFKIKIISSDLIHMFYV